MAGKAESKKRNTEKDRSASRKRKTGRVPIQVVLWVFIFIVLITAIFTILPKLTKDRVEGQPPQEAPLIEVPPALPPETLLAPPSAPQVPPVPPPPQPPVPPPPPAQPPQPPVPPPTAPPAPPLTPSPPVSPPTVPPPAAPPVQPPMETRDRAVYFMQLDSEDNILHPVKVNRKLKVSSSPLHDSLEALLAGPTADEKRRGMESFLPQGSKILSVQIRGNTAFIDFNDEFQFNPLVREGVQAQLKQVVWTATEFPNVHDVQILIEGKRVDFISDGIDIGFPIRR